jgi:superfamily II DNA or RNA helicase
MKYQWEEMIAPRDEEQENVIGFMLDSTNPQTFVTLDVGKGKTFCTGYVAGTIGVKTLIITHRGALQQQWDGSLHDLNGYPRDKIHTIETGKEVSDIINGELELDYDIYLLNHQTFRSALRQIKSLSMMNQLTKKLKIGLKVIDEAHLEFKNTLLVDYAFNVKRNLYLTATAARSNKEENIIFKYVFNNANFYKPDPRFVKKWVNYHMVEIDTDLKPGIYKWQVVKNRGMSPGTYGKWVIKRDKNKTHFKICKMLIKEFFNANDKAKILIFMPLIELCSDLKTYLEEELFDDDSFPYDLNIGTINSSNSKSDNAYNQNCDVIISTIASTGTGTDIAGLTGIINCTPWYSAVISNQVFGRLRYIGTECNFYDIYDTSVPMDVIWIQNRMKVLTKRALTVNHLKWVDPESSQQ